LLKQALNALGKAILVVGSVTYGVVKTLDALSGDFPVDETPEPATKRMDDIEARLIRIEKRVLAPNTENLVTRPELATALDRFSASLDADIERRFEVQDLSVQSLRTMIARTDELLEQVLESIESNTVSA
jgi:hypothetical protein